MAPRLKYDNGDAESELPTIRKQSTSSFRSTTFLRVFKYLILCSAALTLSVFLPTPWSFLRIRTVVTKVPLQTTSTDPASEWKDNVWPLRPQTPWDISTDFRYPRRLEYDVSEGTWLRLDVHPKSGDIVFDMVGDLYCVPATDVAKQTPTTGVAWARPILLGVPSDSDPHFSPEGDRLVFRSDAELGIENIWVMEWKGCEAMDIRSRHAVDENLSKALALKETEEEMLATGIKETAERRYRRLLREGRQGAHRVTNETYRWVSDPRFHPSGSKVIATKWYTSARSLGAGEGWEYVIPSIKDLQSGKQKRIEAGDGTRVLGRSLPAGWTPQEYGDQQIGPEQLIWSGDDSIIYSKNVRDGSSFAYNKDIHSGIYAIFQRNLTSNVTEKLVDVFPGGASRPELSRDGRTLAFVRRVRDKEALVLKDLQTGTIHHVWHGLTYDLTIVSAPMGTYPSFAFTPSDDAIIIWAAGHIYSVPLSTNKLGEKVASKSPFPIRFIVHIEKLLAETLRGGVDVATTESQDTQRVHAMRGLQVDETGKKVVFQAAGVTYLQKVGKKDVTPIPVLHKSAPYYSPSFVHGDEDLILHARWSDTNFTSFELANFRTGITHQIVGLPLGRYISPILSECSSRRRQIAFIKSGGTYLTGDVVATSQPGLYIGDITLPSKDSTKSRHITIHNLHYVKSEINHDDRVNMRFLDSNKKLLVQQSSRAFVIDIDAGPNEFAEYPHRTVATGRMSSEISVTLKTAKEGYVVDRVAFVDSFHVHLARGNSLKEDEPVWTKVGNATKGLARLSVDGGHDVTWSRDGKKVFWFLGPFLHSLEISDLAKCSSEIKTDRTNYGIKCVKDLLNYQEIIVEHSTDIARLKREADAAKRGHESWPPVESGNATDLSRPFPTNDMLVIYNATLLTMATGDPRWDFIEGGVLVSQGGVITGAGRLENTFVPERATAINAHEAYVIPGFIDVHAHWDGYADPYPAKSWEMETFLAYGVTTLHNPSAAAVEGFDERSRIERGQLIGPRIFTVGEVIYGAGEPSLHQDIADQEEAYSALRRLKAEGGPASISYKNYNLPSRASRQRLLIAAQNLSMLCVPEGGMNWDWDLTYIIDGMTTVEHALPVPTLYEDVLTLYALSGTGSTPTHLVNYGGAWGEQLVWATEDIPNDPKLRRFTRHDILEGLSESTARPMNSYALFNTSESVAKMVKKGLLAHIGAHGEPPLGLNYHAEMAFTQHGGLNNYEVLRAATSSAAKTLGMYPSLGSLSSKGLADFLIYKPGVDLLQGDISGTRELRFVVRGGRVWDASTMEEFWPVKGRRQTLAPLNPE